MQPISLQEQARKNDNRTRIGHHKELQNIDESEAIPPPPEAPSKEDLSHKALCLCHGERWSIRLTDFDNRLVTEVSQLDKEHQGQIVLEWIRIFDGYTKDVHDRAWVSYQLDNDRTTVVMVKSEVK